jgi:hypothetical protein
MTNTRAPLVTQTAGQVDFAEKAIAHLLNRFLQGWGGAALASLLDDSVVFARGGNNLLGLEHVV